ncbi:hypothetical protein [Streptomyces dubilierae]|uniref:Uncharacterized protein n=1 Tax=Streptomyces dubilierae TaxID=3075533 RepID=A0ABU2P7L3_9ACTN|nr:hypothetical protein [Streptomyces sp. DSM 41921]MDT0387856.1 hypothetical protein [Streptomyces sp. DSM 41921]
MTTDAYALAGLALVLGLSIGWCWGHSTARVRHVPVGATAAQDDTALDEAWIAERRTQFEDRLSTGDDAGPPHRGLLCFGPTGDWLCRYPAGDGHSDHAPYVEGEYRR